MSYLIDYSKWSRLHEATDQEIANIVFALEKATAGLGTDEDAILSIIKKIPSLEVLQAVNSAMAVLPISSYKSLAELVAGELGTFDMAISQQIKDHLTKLATTSTQYADLQKKNVDKAAKSSQMVQGKIMDGEYAVILGQGVSKEVHLLFGGSHTSGYSAGSARPSAILKYVPLLTPYSTRVSIVITHHMNTLDRAREWVSKNIEGAKVTSIAGFSQGGKETWKHAEDGSLKLVGLIDPSTYETGVRLGPNTYLVCNPDNWGSSGFYGQVKKRLEWYCQNQNSASYSGHVECVKGIRHMDFGILKYFYKKFGDRL